MRILAGDQPLRIEIKGGPIGQATCAVALLHGWGRSGGDFDELVSRLALHFPACAFLQVDLPGFGGSPLRRQDGLSLDDYCTTLAELFKKIEVTRVTLIGHSLGGRIAMKFVALHPERVEKLVLISAAGIPFRSMWTLLLALGRKLFQTALYAFGDFGPMLRLKNLLGATLGSRDYRTSHGALRETLKKVLAEDLRGDAKKISVPTLLLWGKNDQITPPRDGAEYHSLIKGSRLEMLDGGHFVFLEKPEESAAAVASFLQNG